MPFVALLFIGQAIFAYNLLRTLGSRFFAGWGPTASGGGVRSWVR